MRFVHISDTHSSQPDLPEGDVLIDSGDMGSRGRIQDIAEAAAWRGSLIKEGRFKKVICIAGNHDWLFQKNYSLAKGIMEENGIIYLEDSWYDLDGILIYGSPWQPEFNNWAFNLPRGPKLAERWSHIPDDTDILVTHGPPYGILDIAPRDGGGNWEDQKDLEFYGEKVGCYELLLAVRRVRPKFHLFGHIHASYGCKEVDGTTFLNGSIMDEQYDPVRKPHVFELGAAGETKVEEPAPTSEQ